jgi:glycosyltransferase involved in cell wall biosynthesis
VRGVSHALGGDTVTVAITTRNAGHLLGDCLASVAFADEIIVVDMFSTDDTADVCAAYPQCRVIHHEGYMMENLNIAFDEARSDWILRIDTDERLTSELAAEVQNILRDPPDDITGFEFWERPIMLGRELHHGFGRRHYKKSMFRRGAARFRVEHDHEDLDTSGTWLRMKHGYIHFNYPSVGLYLTKMNYYTENDIARTSLGGAHPTTRTLVVEPLRAFYLYYLKYRGYRDGWVGLVDATMRAFYQFVQHAKIRERWERERAGGSWLEP